MNRSIADRFTALPIQEERVSGEMFRELQPVVTPRAMGGYLAVSAPGSHASIGVTGDTEAEARENFYKEREAWAKLSEREVTLPATPG
jgi:hypothetical protein